MHHTHLTAWQHLPLDHARPGSHHTASNQQTPSRRPFERHHRQVAPAISATPHRSTVSLRLAQSQRRNTCQRTLTRGRTTDHAVRARDRFVAGHLVKAGRMTVATVEVLTTASVSGELVPARVGARICSACVEGRTVGVGDISTINVTNPTQDWATLLAPAANSLLAVLGHEVGQLSMKPAVTCHTTHCSGLDKVLLSFRCKVLFEIYFFSLRPWKHAPISSPGIQELATVFAKNVRQRRGGEPRAVLLPAHVPQSRHNTSGTIVHWVCLRSKRHCRTLWWGCIQQRSNMVLHHLVR